jgi:hypothetical protein
MITDATPQKDKATLRELAKRYAEIAADEKNAERVERIKDMHSLKQVRPPLWFDQLPWNELNETGELTLVCETEADRRMEWYFRSKLFQWKYFQGDMIAGSAYWIMKSYTDSGIGISYKTEGNDSALIHVFEDQLDTEEKVEALKLPVITALPEKDRANVEWASEILDGILPVKLLGHELNNKAWDSIARFRGVTRCLMDMMDNPGLTHGIIKKFEEIAVSRFTQMLDQELLDYRQPSMNCAPTHSRELPAKDYDGGKQRLKDLWWTGTAQIMVSASPRMNWEFNLQYLLPFMSQCGLSFYGCCEPLDNFIPYLKRVPNLRKISASPWTKLRSQAEQMGSGYVLARRPNPGLVAGVINEEAVRQEIAETIEVCRETKTPFEYVLKDVSTVGGKLQNLVDWHRIVTETIDRYYR